MVISQRVMSLICDAYVLSVELGSFNLLPGYLTLNLLKKFEAVRADISEVGIGSLRKYFCS